MTRDAPHLRYAHLFVVIRIDTSVNSGPLEERIALVSAYASLEMAEMEVDRLQVLAGDKPWRYLTMVTRLKDSE